MDSCLVLYFTEMQTKFNELKTKLCFTLRIHLTKNK